MHFKKYVRQQYFIHSFPLENISTVFVTAFVNNGKFFKREVFTVSFTYLTTSGVTVLPTLPVNMM